MIKSLLLIFERTLLLLGRLSVDLTAEKQSKQNHSLIYITKKTELSSRNISSIKHLVLLSVLFLCSTILIAQENNELPNSLTLEEAINYGLENNYQAINARRDIAKSLKQKWETTAAGLPQVNGQVGYTNNAFIPAKPYCLLNFLIPSASRG